MWAIALCSLLICACAGGPVVEVEPCVEIPFLDAAEGACTNTVTHKAYLVPSGPWAEEKKKGMIMLRARDWSKIRVAWLKACMGSNECNVYVYSVDRALKDLDSLVKDTFPKP